MIHFELVTPERVLYKQDVDAVTLPTTMGEVTMYPDHAPLVATLVPGVARITHKDLEEDIAVSGGFIEMRAGSNLRVLADTAERGHELDLTVIEKARIRAEQVMREAINQNDAAYAHAAAAMERELARYKVARKHHAGRGVPMLDRSSLPHDENPT